MSTEQHPDSETGAGTPEGPRPGRLTAAAAIAAVEGLALVGGGLFMLVMGLMGKPDQPRQAVTGGVTLIALGIIPLVAARGLLLRRRWSRGPALITQILALPVAYMFLTSDGPAIPVGIVTAALAVTGLVQLVNPATAEALGVRGTGGTR
ncbi:hypothetical protein A8W25_20540 [Streptomyces sp. ERV7]|uniref:hypothetical protein n=1 Tax=Streptomyces sp. ERV7 TaxID=1322334 RepID=UPI0007F3F308|nr:hypothetical protein [Streptomyces sp. ERV7]OAR24743.1 hypothetical protein A8W25_20540 [Streptomyces sp. ERV7]